jgi:2'-5' RNA ligase
VSLLKTVGAVDFDGVLNSYTSGTHPGPILDAPVPGAVEWLTAACERFQMVIFSVRAETAEGHQQIAGWLEANGMGSLPLTITNVKPPSAWFLDDRAVVFTGPDSWPTMDALENFEPWWSGEGDGDIHDDLPDVEGDDAATVAASVAARAAYADFEITRAVERAALTAGGSLAGLENRLKSDSALEWKINRNLQAGMQPLEAGLDVKDSLRYTVLLNASAYTTGSEAVLGHLRASGGVIQRVRNYWASGDGTYVGLNAVVAIPAGFTFEVQFHTPESRDVQTINWPFYRLMRMNEMDGITDEKVKDVMRANNALVPVPPGATGITASGGLCAPLAPVAPLIQSFEADTSVDARSTMVALKPRPEEAARLSPTNPEILHVTLAYLGKTTGPLDSVAAALARVAGTHAPLDGVIGGAGAFAAGADGHPLILLPSAPGLIELRVDATEALTDAGVEYGRNFGYVPHMTLDYTDKPGIAHIEKAGEPVHFDSLLIVRGDNETIDLPLTGGTPVTAGGKGPILTKGGKPHPMGKAGLAWANYHGPVTGKKRCGTCSYFAAGQHNQCGMFDTAVDSHYTCREWSHGLNPTDDDPMPYALAAALEVPEGTKGPLVRVPPRDAHNRVLVAGYKRADELIPKLAALLEPLLNQIADEAARNFTARATDHLTAAAAQWSAPAPDEIVNMKQVVSQLRGKTDPVRMAVVNSVMQPVLESAGIAFDATNPLTAKVLAQSGSQVTNIAETTQLNVMRAINHAHAEGLSIPDTAKAIRSGMRDASPARATLIARTELVGAVNGGSLAAAQIVDDASGDQAGGLFKQWLCLAPGSRISAAGVYAVIRKPYEGDLVRVTVRVPAGRLPGACPTTRRFTVTPDHLVLTQDGWVPAGLLRERSKVFGAAPREGNTRSNPDVNDAEPLVEEVFDTAHVAAGMVAAPVYLHSHEPVGEKIDVVAADGGLGNYGAAEFDEPLRELMLTLSDVRLDELLRDRFGPNRSIRHRGSGAGKIAEPPLGPERLGVSGMPDEVGLALAPQHDVLLEKDHLDGAVADTESAADALSGLAALVALHEVTEVDRFPFSGHVYDCATLSGWLLSDGIVAHNTSPGAQYPRHEEYDGLDGQTVRLDDTFEVGADQLQYPGDPDGSPEEVCNCRCSLAYTDDASQLSDAAGGAQGLDTAEAQTGEELGGPLEPLDDPLTDGAAKDYLDGYAADWGASLTKDQKDALLAWKSPEGYERINGALRSGEALTGQTADQVSAIDSAIASAPALSQDTSLTVYRGVTDAHTLLPDVPKIGDRFTDIGYQSVTTDENIAHDYALDAAHFYANAENPVMFQIQLPEGQKGAWLRAAGVEKKGATPFEDDVLMENKEMVLPRDQEYEVVRIGDENELRRAFQRTEHPLPLITLRPVSPVPVAGPEVPDYLKGLKAEQTSLGNKVANIQWYINKGTASDLQRARLQALQERLTDVKNLLYAHDQGVPDLISTERATLAKELSEARGALKDMPKDAYWKEKVKLLELRSTELEKILGEEPVAPAVAETKIDPAAYLTGLKKERDSAGNKIANLVWKQRNKPDTFTDDDRARLAALRQYQANLKQAVVDKAEPETEISLLKNEIANATGPYKDQPEAPHYVKLLQARLDQIEALRAPAIAKVAPVFTGKLAEDLAAIRAQAQWLTKEQVVSGQLKGEPQFVGGIRSVYRDKQVEAVIAAGRRMEEAMAVDPKLEQLYQIAKGEFDAAQAGKEPESIVALARKHVELDNEFRAQRQVFLERVARTVYGKDSYYSLTVQQQEEVIREANKDAGLNAIRDRLADANRALSDARSEWYQAKANARENMKLAGNEYMTARRENLMDALSSVRSMGAGDVPEEKMKFDTYNGKNLPGYRWAQARIEDAARFFPRDWISKARPMAAQKSTRGMHTSGGVVKMQISEYDKGLVTADDPGLSTAIHEFGHEVEETTPRIVELEQTFYERRTRGGDIGGEQEPLVKLSKLFPGRGYGPNEVVREDKFSEPYMGKDYGGRNYELLTMGLEDIWNGAYGIDAEYRQFILGILAIL